VTLHGRTLLVFGLGMIATCWAARYWYGILVLGAACLLAAGFCESRRSR
jgi:hypothetical protein